MPSHGNDNEARSEPPGPAATTPRPTDADTAGGPGDAPPGAADTARVVAVRRFAAARSWRGLQVTGCAVLLAVALSAGAVAVGGAREGAGAVPGGAPAGRPGAVRDAGPDVGIPALEARLRAQPRDFEGWAALGLAHVELARTDGDPSRYPRAERALKRSLELRPGNDRALSGRAALAAARHDFATALAYADRALAANPYDERALCSRVDALVELGRYDDAARAADTADTRRPGVPVFTRYAYVRELRGETDTARKVLERALAVASSPADVAYVATQLGHLARRQGDQPAALRHYARALAADDAYLPALEGRARARAASGDRDGAAGDLERVVARAPLPGPLVALGELYEVRGEPARAREQYALVDAWTALARAGGVEADLDTALAAADHGDRKAALRAARAEWDRRRTVHTADAVAWALHVNGLDREALPYARRAVATGYRDASFLYHLGVIERAVGRHGDARRHLSAALGLDPGFSPLGAREARRALKELEGAR
ncbi:tetratricopeptide repeat protein [Streptomyces sp. NPDC053780]|uniref:tetratricopeptide repeat protein n=1 Tax=unclassified Streptomyces TaxID=2593676 RepID=UPI0034284FDB